MASSFEKRVVSKRGHRGKNRIAVNCDKSLPRVHYVTAGEGILICFKAKHGKDKVIAKVHDPRSAKGICDVINNLRARVAKLEEMNTTLTLGCVMSMN